ncbi:MAG: methylmalonyl-CoA mutase family protein, partial [Planctomycetota bacterium]|nr:methylmalonyl-CoA mutase family protein [Planctomycetota bacterium]
MSDSSSDSSPRDEILSTSGLTVPVCAFSEDAKMPTDGPGEFPFTRGIHPNMYRGRLWTMRQ